MTVQEKSKELVWKFYHNIEHTISNEYADKDWEISKQCALIAVDEIVKCAFWKYNSIEHINYWKEVKQEIELLV